MVGLGVVMSLYSDITSVLRPAVLNQIFMAGSKGVMLQSSLDRMYS